MTETNLAAETDRILAHAAALRVLEDTTVTSSNSGQFGMVTSSVEQVKAQVAVTETLKIADEDLLTMREQSTKGLATLIASMQEMDNGLEKNSNGTKVTKDAQAVLTKSREEATAILEKLIKNTDMSAEVTEKAQEELKALADALKVGLKAYEDFNELVKQAKDQSRTTTFGVMAEELDTLTASKLPKNRLSD